MSTANSLITAEVYGFPVRVLSYGHKLWLSTEDLANVIEYRTRNGITAFYARHKRAMEAHSLKAKIDGEGWAVRLFDEFGVRYFCEFSKRPGAFHLLRWLDAGGMSIEGVRAVKFPDVSNVLAFKATNSAPSAGKSERQRAYCRDLLKTLLRYATDAETDELTHTIESEVADLLNRRHCPGLNDARYELYRRFWLSGGEA
jgi:hypothetical protein